MTGTGGKSESSGGQNGERERSAVINEEPEGVRLWQIEIDGRTRQDS